MDLLVLHIVIVLSTTTISWESSENIKVTTGSTIPADSAIQLQNDIKTFNLQQSCNYSVLWIFESSITKKFRITSKLELDNTQYLTVLNLYPLGSAELPLLFKELWAYLKISNCIFWQLLLVFPSNNPSDLFNVREERGCLDAELKTNSNDHLFTIPINSEVVVVLDGQSKDVTIRRTCNYENLSSGKPVNNSTGIYCGREFKLDLYKYFSNESGRVNNLSGIHINAVGQDHPDYQYRLQIKTYPNGSVEFTGGMCLSIWKELQFMTGFSFKAINGKGWLGIFPNGTWTGMAGQVVNGEADIAIVQASTIYLDDEVHGISLLHPTSWGKLVAIFRQPPSSSIRDVVTAIFTPYLWGFGFITWILLIMCIRIIYRIHIMYGILNESDKMFIRDSTWWAVSTTCSMGWHTSPYFGPLRIMVASGYFLAVFVFVAYSAALMSTILTETVSVHNFVELSLSQIDILVDKSLPMSYGVLKELHHNRKNHEDLNEDLHYMDFEQAVPLILKSQSAFITFEESVTVVFHRLNYSDSYFCNTIDTVMMSKVPIPNTMYVKRGDPLKEIFNTKIVKMIERGFISRLNKEYDSNTKIFCPMQLNNIKEG